MVCWDMIKRLRDFEKMPRDCDVFMVASFKISDQRAEDHTLRSYNKTAEAAKLIGSKASSSRPSSPIDSPGEVMAYTGCIYILHMCI